MNDPMPEIRRILNMPAHDATNSHGWANGRPADQTDYTRDARECAIRGDNVRANYFVEQAHLSNLIAYWTAMTDATAGQLEPDAEDALTELYGQITKRLGLR
jgi:hypothetical protein